MVVIVPPASDRFDLNRWRDEVSSILPDKEKLRGRFPEPLRDDFDSWFERLKKSEPEFKLVETVQKRFDQVLEDCRLIESTEQEFHETLHKMALKKLDLADADFSALGRKLAESGAFLTVFSLSGGVSAFQPRGLDRLMTGWFSNASNASLSEKVEELCKELIERQAREEIEVLGYPVSDEELEEFVTTNLQRRVTWSKFLAQRQARKKGEGGEPPEPRQVTSEPPSEDKIQETYEQFFRMSDEKLNKLRKKRDRLLRKKPEKSKVVDLAVEKRKRDPERDEQVRRTILEERKIKEKEYRDLREKIKKKLRKGAS
ncbi:MAG: hypothetical protein Kow0069_00890 [Promethearchaeota archaeon]